MTKEEVFELIKEASKNLLNTDLIIYPCGSLSKDDKTKINGLSYFDGIDKPEFVDMRDYRKSLLQLISKLIYFYKEV